MPTSHHSYETLGTTFTPGSNCPAHTRTDPSDPLLAQKPTPSRNPDGNISRLLQLQTQAAYRPSTQSLQSGNGTSPTSSDSSITSDSSTMSPPPSIICCCRCRRDHCHSSMFQFGTNIYYCSHCAQMVGYAVEERMEAPTII
ncbi:hypothetical protein PSPO01_16628 [Paraphaeosphaeria sporulosa]